jgi:WS/DGAT/MGAT family acyltransferase
MRQLSPLDTQFLMIESPTTLGHVGSLVMVDPSTTDGDTWNVDTVRALIESRLHLVPIFRQRLAEVPFGLTRPYWVDDPYFDLEFHIRELAIPQPGSSAQLGEQVARLHARALDRQRPLWELYVITGLEDGRAAVYSKVHHAAIDGVSGAELLSTLLDIRPEPRQVEPEVERFDPRPLPSKPNLLGRGLASMLSDQVQIARTVPPALRHLDQLPGAGSHGIARGISDAASAVARLTGAKGRAEVSRTSRDLKAPRTPLNGPVTAHRRFSFGSVPLADIKTVRRRYGGTVNDIVMVLCTTALRRWLLDHGRLPDVPLVAAVPVSVRRRAQEGSAGNQISVMLAELPTHLADPEARLEAMHASMELAKGRFGAVPPTLLRDLSRLMPTAGSGLAARSLFNLATVPGPPFNLFISHVPGPQVPLYVAGAKVRGVYPVSAVTSLTGALNITLFSYNRALDFGLIACRELMPDVWNLIGYLSDALAELVELSQAAS